jgi:hypothetical protein
MGGQEVNRAEAGSRFFLRPLMKIMGEPARGAEPPTG